MDPISVVASAIAVATLAGQICTAFANLRSLCRSLPGRLHALNNEVADLEIVLLELASLVEKRTHLPDRKQSAIPHLLRQANTKLLELQNLVGRLRSTSEDTRFPLVTAHVFRREQTNLQRLQEDIRSVRCNLNILLGASNSQDMMQMRLDLESISVFTSQSSQEQIALQDQLASSLAGVDERIARVEEMLLAQAENVRESQLIQVGTSYASAARRRPSPVRPRVSTSSSQAEGFSVRVTPYTVACRPGCSCSCHSQQKTSSPGMLSRVLGQLFVGYSGVPYLSPKCDQETCGKSRASNISMEYWFPIWFLSSTIVQMKAGYQPSIGTIFQLQTLRSVPDSAQCVKFALSGNIESLKYLFSNGMASARDVSPARGYTLLRWALYGKQYETCEFLIHAGADPDYRPLAASDNSPRIKACHFLLEGGLSDTGVDALRLITKGGRYDDFIDESRFTQAHRIVLGLSLKSLEEELVLHPEDTDAQDAMGRTPLAWAAARGDTRTVVTLLSHGADPNIIDVQISGAVSNAAARGYTACVRLLLEAGAHPDPPVPVGIKKGSPLNVAARNATDVLLLKSLLDFGADIDSCGTDGDTALIHAARNDNASFALLFLEYGADINATSATSATPLTTAITYNSHNVLRLILDHWHEYSDCPRFKGPHLLQIAALYADVTTLQILAGTDHLRVRKDKTYAIGDFSSRLRQRPDHMEKLALAFDELLSAINGSPDPRKSPESLLESGLMPRVLKRVDKALKLAEGGEKDHSDDSSFISCPASPVDSNS
ncbi:MAG: hypothetical protein M4579_006462, partial [Chaenotheca gracillima]